MPSVRLIHWNAAEAKERAARLAAVGYAVDNEVPRGLGFLRELKEDPPDAIIIDLDRLPSQGRDVAVVIRHTTATRRIPLVFTGGEPGKVARIRKILPDAVFTSWTRLPRALKRAMTHSPLNPVAPRSVFEGYASVPLPKKLGIKADSTVALINAPPGFIERLGKLPDGVHVDERWAVGHDLIVWFVRSCKELDRELGKRAPRIGDGAVWVVWPKRASGVSSDLTQQSVRKAGLAAGLVDYKICAIDATWSGLLFTRRRSKSARV